MAKTELLESMTIHLRKPVSLGSETVECLELREPTVGELQQFDRLMQKEGAIAATTVLIALVAGTSKPLVEKIGVRDFRKAEAFLAGFINVSPTDGGMPSP